jgi:DNA repair protein RadD
MNADPNATATSRRRPTLDLVMFDFATSYAQQPEDALVQLERLVLDREVCLARIAFLRATAEKLRDQVPEKPSRRAQADLASEIRLVASGRLLDAHQEGKLTPDRVRLLHQLSCDPEALWRVHRLIVSSKPTHTTQITDQIVKEVVETVLEQGGLIKAQVMETWAIAEEDYKELQKRVLAKDNTIEKGPKKAGGFEVRKRKGKLPDESESDTFLLRTDSERKTVQRLSELLQHNELEDLLGHLLQTVRRARKEQTGRDRRGTKAELATALVIMYSIDLFAEGEVRKAVAKAAKIKYPERWHPGKNAALEFVAGGGFPRELAGIPTPDSLPDYEFLEGRFSLKPLEEFQHEVKGALLQTLGKPGARALVTLPTGAGKTRVAVESIRDWLTSRYDTVAKTANGAAVLWLAHTEELCEQACACFKQVWEASQEVCPLLLVRFWGRYTQDLARHRETLAQVLSRPGVLVSTPQRIVNLLDGRIMEAEGVVEELKQALGLLLVDEAHRAAAPSYRRILGELLPAGRPVAVAGLTATPFRMEYVGDDPEEGTRELKDLFRNLIEPMGTLGQNPRLKLQDMRILATPVFETIRTPTTMRLPDLPVEDAMSEETLERIDRVLAVQTDNTPRRLEILKRVLPLAQSDAHSILYFGPSVRDAECMAFLLRREGIPAAVVSANTREVTRRQVIAEFKQRKLRVLCNCEVLTTGFDAPQVTHIVMARPTASRVLYEQIVGRGLRGSRFGGTDSCVILDCEDTVKGDRPPLGYERFRKVWEGEVGRR